MTRSLVAAITSIFLLCYHHKEIADVTGGGYLGIQRTTAVHDNYNASLTNAAGDHVEATQVSSSSSHLPEQENDLLLSVPFYIYEEMDWLNEDKVTTIGNFTFKEWISATPQERDFPTKHDDDIHFYLAATKHPMRVMDPAKAKLFFVPSITTLLEVNFVYNKGATHLMCRDGICGRDLMVYMNKLLQNSTWFQRSGGKDHVALLTYIHWAHPSWYNRDFPNFKRCNVIQFGDGNKKWNNKDRISHQTMYVGSRCNTVPYSEKTHDIAMIGSLRERAKHQKEINNFMDRRKICQWSRFNQTDQRYSMKFCGKGKQCPALANAKFGFHVRGDTISANRLFDTLLSGTIPIFTMKEQYKAHQSFIDWEQLSYFIQMGKEEGSAGKASFKANLDWIVKNEAMTKWKTQAILDNKDLFDFETLVPFDTYLYMFQAEVYPKLPRRTSCKYSALILPPPIVATNSSTSDDKGATQVSSAHLQSDSHHNNQASSKIKATKTSSPQNDSNLQGSSQKKAVRGSSAQGSSKIKARKTPAAPLQSDSHHKGSGKIAILSNFLPQQGNQEAPDAKLFDRLMNKACYADTHGYDFVYNISWGFPDEVRAPNNAKSKNDTRLCHLDQGDWHRVPQLMSLLESDKDYEWILWADDDYVFWDMEQPLESLINELKTHKLDDVHVVVPDDGRKKGGEFLFSSFAVLIRNSNFGRAVVKNWMDFATGLCPNGNFEDTNKCKKYNWKMSDQPGLWYALGKTYSDLVEGSGDYGATCNEETGYIDFHGEGGKFGLQMARYFESEGFVKSPDYSKIPHQQPILWSSFKKNTGSGLGINLNVNQQHKIPEEQRRGVFGFHNANLDGKLQHSQLQNCAAPVAEGGRGCHVGLNEEGVFDLTCGNKSVVFRGPNGLDGSDAKLKQS